MDGRQHEGSRAAFRAALRPFWPVVVGVLPVIIAVLVLRPSPRTLNPFSQSFWRTRDQQAQRLFDLEEYAAAAERFSDPMRQGAALFKDAQFEAAASAFARVNTPEGHFNRGNALVMRGRYDDAIEAYERALSLRAEWPAATNNLEIARVRAERLKREGGDMTGGQLGADEIVFETGKGREDGGQTQETAGGEALSDAELQSLWLRRVQTKPADFLRAKFAFQLSMQSAAPIPEESQ